jgi:signal transduction histidine kinase
VAVSDTGPGIPPEIASRLFQPFFTTKGTDGTGLGLVMVQACMHRIGGDVALASAPGAGTTFTLTFPPIASSTSP